MRTEFLINGKWCSSSDTLAVRNPFTATEIARVPLASPDQILAALASASAAQPACTTLPAHKKSQILNKIAALITSRSAEFRDLIIAEAGKPFSLAELEVQRASITFQLAASAALESETTHLRMDASQPGENHTAFVRRCPIGPILGITPFNFPLNLVAHKIAPAIASGCTIIIKPSPRTPLTALLLSEVIHHAGALPGQVHILPFHHEHVPLILEDPRLRMLSFTGSAEIGWQLKSRAVKQKVTLELGGNAAVIIEPDTDISEAASLCAKAAFAYAGQSCISLQRILVHTHIADAFRKAFIEATLQCHVGDPTHPSTLIGPMIDPAARARIVHLIHDALARGAQLLTPLKESGPSTLAPVILENVPHHAPIWHQEAFAPVAILREYQNFQEALDITNNSTFGLQTGIFTSSIFKALLAYDQLEVGSVLINQVPTFRVENMPYGGVKDSGLGREGIRSAIEEMTVPRTLIIRSPEKRSETI